MGLIGELKKWVIDERKKQCRRGFWRLRAAMKKAIKKNASKKRFMFQYDPSSYALNFDDGCCDLREKFNDAAQDDTCFFKNSTLVYIILVI
ncbi:hypothetical protein ACHQM5_017426 [Ranunculus cassubicifolius]